MPSFDIEEIKVGEERVPSPKCIICNGDVTEFLCEADNSDVWHCSECKTDFVWPMPNHQRLKELYDRWEWFEGGEYGGYENYDEQTDKLPTYLEEVFREIDPGGAQKRVLDIGCGYGTHLAVAVEQGWQCVGVEVSEHARSIIKQRHGDNIYLLERIESLPPGQFDLVLMLDVIVHLADPYPLFFTLYKKGIIGPQTRIVLTTPNAQSCEAVADPSSWAYRHPPSHLVYYSAQSLFCLLRSLKWKSVKIEGLHPLAGREINSENGEPSLNKKLEGYEGLLCTATGSDFTEFMHERYVPGTWNKITEYEHIPRYIMAQRLAADLKVLDFGCGTGYGSVMLAEKAEFVLGVDISEEALQWASNHHINSRLRFEQRADFGAGLPDSSFDMISCFEMIEHVDQQTQELLIKNFRRLLGPQGKLVISTPNPEVTENYGENPYHLHEMSEEDFTALLGRYFEHVQIFRQWIRPSVLIARQSLFSQTEGVYACSVGIDSKLLDLPAVAYIAICSSEPLAEVEGVCNFDSSFDFVSKSIEEINNSNQTYIEKYSMFQRNRNNEKALKENQEVLAGQANSIQSQQEVIAEKESAIQGMSDNFVEQASNIEKLRGFIVEKDSALTEQAKWIQEQAKLIQSQQEVIAEKESAIQEMTDNFAEQARNIEGLR